MASWEICDLNWKFRAGKINVYNYKRKIFQQAMFDYQSVNQKSTFFEHVDYMFKKCGILMNVVVRND